MLMAVKIAFHTSVPVLFRRYASAHVNSRKRATFGTLRKQLVVKACAKNHPDAGLISKAGVTGTVCTNLFPLPILGAYGWFLTVYKRDTAASVGPFAARIVGPYAIQLKFLSGKPPEKSDRSDTHVTIKGVAAGNLNVRNAVKRLLPQGGPFELQFFERGGSELLSNRRNELHAGQENTSDDLDNSAWNEVAPTYRTVASEKGFVVREVYSGADEAPRNAARFEWFSMNLFPLFPLAKYSAFVCVWRQRRDTSPVAIDKRGKELHLRVVDSLALPDNTEVPSPVAKFAVAEFNGAVSDASATKQHRKLLTAITASSSVTALSETDFRILVDNKPNTFTQRRRNEIWVPIQ